MAAAGTLEFSIRWSEGQSVFVYDCLDLDAATSPGDAAPSQPESVAVPATLATAVSPANGGADQATACTAPMANRSTSQTSLVAETPPYGASHFDR